MKESKLLNLRRLRSSRYCYSYGAPPGARVAKLTPLLPKSASVSSPEGGGGGVHGDWSVCTFVCHGASQI